MAAESSMLELLSVTDAAVKSLNKSTRSNSLASSRSSHSSRGSVPHSHSRDKVRSPDSTSGRQGRDNIHSPDSGICKTYTATDGKSQRYKGINQDDYTTGVIPLDWSSDESTTASDVLIRSTLADPSEPSFHDIGQNVSSVSKCSKSSFGADNFNSSGPQKVKISTKRLREIKSPFESDRNVKNTEEDIPPVLSKVDKTDKIHPATTKKFSPEATNRNYVKNEIVKTKVPKDLIQTLPMESEDETDTSQNWKASKIFNSFVQNKDNNREMSDFNTRNLPRFPGDKLERTDTIMKSKHIKMAQTTGLQKEKNKDQNISPRSDSSYKKKSPRFPGDKSDAMQSDPSKYLIEKHLSVNSGKNTEVSPPLIDDDDEWKSKDKLNDSVDLIPSKENDVINVSRSSCCLSQPEIITVPERIVTISARNSVSASDVSASDSGTIEEEKIPPKLSARFHLFSRANGVSLQQGAPVEGVDEPDKQKHSQEIHISKYSLSDKEKLVKQSFFKRYEQAGPVRRVVQPKFVGRDKNDRPDKTTEDTTTGQSSQVLTAAVAASAAVAATQPFLKAQHDLETKMTEILDKIAEVQGKGGKEKEINKNDDRVKELEKQVSAMTEQRIEHLEKLQEQQLQMQAKLLSLTRTSPETGLPVSFSRRSLSPLRKTELQDKRAFSKTKVQDLPKVDYKERKSQYMSDTAEHISPFSTPAPRSRAPRPVAYDTSDIDVRSGSNSFVPERDTNSRGILEEILASAESPRRGIPAPIMPTRSTSK